MNVGGGGREARLMQRARGCHSAPELTSAEGQNENDSYDTITLVL